MRIANPFLLLPVHGESGAGEALRTDLEEVATLVASAEVLEAEHPAALCDAPADLLEIFAGC